MKKLIFAGSLFLLFFVSCTSVKLDLSADEYSAEQLIQMGQERGNVRDYKNAIACYEEVINRYGDNPAHYVEARYEIGRVNLKQKKYQEAYDVFNEILNLYTVASYSVLPPSYRKLAQISIDQIPENKLPKTSDEF